MPDMREWDTQLFKFISESASQSKVFVRKLDFPLTQLQGLFLMLCTCVTQGERRLGTETEGSKVARF